MSRAELNKPAPNFTLTDFNGNEISLAGYQGKKNVLLVFNRGFI
jgi:peroxiredoxin